MTPVKMPAVRAPYRYLGVFRLVLASLVVMQHASALLPAGFADAIGPLEVGGIAVYGFFIVSGFVIVEAVTAFYPDRPFAFLSNRLLRLLPAYAVALALTAIVLAMAFPSFVPGLNETPITPDRFAVRTALLNLFALFPIWRLIETRLHVPEMLEQVWALRIEFLFYIVIAAAVVLANVVRAALASVLAVLAVGCLLAITVTGHRTDGSFLENAPYFVFGVAFFFVLARDRERWFPAAFCLSAGVFAVTHLLGRAPTFGPAELPRDRLGEVVLLSVMAVAFVCLARCPDGGARAARVKRFDRFCGDLTYPLYLMHSCVLVAARTWLPRQHFASAALAFLSAYALAALTVLIVEKPVARLRAMIRRRPLSPADASTVRAAPSAN